MVYADGFCPLHSSWTVGPPATQPIPTGLGLQTPSSALDFPPLALGHLLHFQPEYRQLSWNQKRQNHGVDAAAITNQSQPSFQGSLDVVLESPLRIRVGEQLGVIRVNRLVAAFIPAQGCRAP